MLCGGSLSYSSSIEASETLNHPPTMKASITPEIVSRLQSIALRCVQLQNESDADLGPGSQESDLNNTLKEFDDFLEYIEDSREES